MRNYNYKEFWPLNLTKSSEFDAWKKGMRVKLDQRWRIRLTLPPFTSLVVERLVYMVIWIHRGRSREMKLQVRLNSKESCFNNFIIIPFQFRIESILLQWSSFLMMKFHDVWKLTTLCGLFHSSSFGASFPVNTKEFLWDLSFNVNLFFYRPLDLYIWRDRLNSTRERRRCESSLTRGEG